MERIAYVLGAGFSAPLGLPVMSNFLIKSKDAYLTNQDAYQCFTHVFETINDLSKIKNYCSSNLFNIEEVLSLVEMKAFLEGKALDEEFIEYIKNVILHYTPKHPQKYLPSNWQDFIFGGDTVHEYYGKFVGNLFNLEFKLFHAQASGGGGRELRVHRDPEAPARYAVVTLNYDMVLENILRFLNENYGRDERLQFNKDEDVGEWIVPPLAKLHGSVDTNIMIPPTWSKGNNIKIAPTWKAAYQILQQANHIRFIGFSLPVSDAYVRYLFKSAMTNSEHLKTIDVICIDEDGSVKGRYDEFIQFDYYRFRNARAEECLRDLNKRGGFPRPEQAVKMNTLERVHNAFMRRVV